MKSPGVIPLGLWRRASWLLASARARAPYVSVVSFAFDTGSVYLAPEHLLLLGFPPGTARRDVRELVALAFLEGVSVCDLTPSPVLEVSAAWVWN